MWQPQDRLTNRKSQGCRNVVGRIFQEVRLRLMFGGLKRVARQPVFTVPTQLTYDCTRSKVGAFAARILRKEFRTAVARLLCGRRNTSISY